MSVAAWMQHATEALVRGHQLYARARIEPAPFGIADELGRLTDTLHRSAATDAELARLLSAAHAGHDLGRTRTRTVLDDARADRMPAADTPMGQREAARRMAERLHTQRRAIHRSHHQARQLAHRMNRLGYPQRRASKIASAQAIPLNALGYRRTGAPGRIRQRIAAALDRLGIVDPRARRNWIAGYQTLIARESGGRPSAVASEPATAPGPTQPDGYGLGYARGLTQTIPATFAHYHQPGTSTNIYDPVANICASMNYVIARYGVHPDGANLVALVQQADPHRAPKGY